MKVRRVDLVLAGLLTCVMLTTFVHPYLFRRDEPREAEIARETLVDNHWVTPHLCGLPFLEKPPLYYDFVAAAYAVTGSITPPVARFISITFGALMAATVLAIGYRWGGPRRGWLAALILVAMPEFYKYSHLIVLDIAVGAFSTLAMAAFVWWLLWSSGGRGKRLLLCLFYLAMAGAFLTKGLAGVFHVAVTIAAFCLLTRRWSTFAGLLRPVPMLLFAVPVGVWLLLFYREGGIGYLHEHFVNNVIGRFLGVQFQLPNVRFSHTDVGTPKGWYFYLESAPRMFGLAVPVLPFALWAAARRTKQASCSQDSSGPSTRDLPMLLAIWAMLPVLLLSFASNKETSYILPSCAAAALLAAWWLDEHLLPGDAMQWRDIGWLMIVLPAVVMNIFFSWMDVWTYQAIGLFVLAPAVLGLAVTLRRRRFVPGTFGLLGAALYLVILCHSPNVDAVTWGFGRALSSEVWSRVGQAELYLYHPDDIARGCIPFYRNRLTPEIDRPSELQRVLASDQKVFVLMRTQRLDRLHPAEIAAGTWMLHALPDLDPDHRYVLISNVRD